MKLLTRAAVLGKKISLMTTAFVLAVSTLTAAVPFVLVQNASAATTVNSTAELQAAVAGSDSEIVLGSNFTVTEQVTINRALTLNGNNKKLTAALTAVASGSNDSVLSISQPVVINNLTVDGASINGVQGIQIYKTSATLNNVTVQNNKKAGLNVNGSNVTVTNITTSNNGTNFGGIHLSKGSGVTATPTVTINGQSRHTNEPKHIYTDVAGVVNDTNAQYTPTAFLVWATYQLKAAPVAPVITAPAQNFLGTSSTVALTWNTASYAHTYDVNVDGVVTTGLTGNSYSLTGLTEGAHTVQLRSVAKSGLQGAWGAVRNFSLDLNDVPEVTVATPAAGSVVSTKLSTNLNKLQLKGTFTDDEAINYLQFELVKAGNLVTVGTMHYFMVNADGTYTYNLDVPTNLATGEYSLFFTGTDFEGGVTSRFERIFTIDNTKPVVELLSPTNAGPFKVAGSTVSVKATDNIGVSKIVANIYKDNVLFKSTQVSVAGLTSATHTVDLSTVVAGGLPTGNYSVKYNALDTAGNLSSTGQFSFAIDDAAPAAPTALGWTTSGGTATNTTNDVNGVASWSASASGDVSHYIYKYWNDIPGNPYKEASPWVNPSNIYGLSLAGSFTEGQGVHYFSVAAVDYAGNQSDWSDPFQITYDTAAPAVEITSVSRTLVTGTADADAQVVLSIDGTDTAPITPEADGTWSYTISPALAVGTHSFSAVASDAAGNTATATHAPLTVFAVTPVVTPTLQTTDPDDDTDTQTVQTLNVPATISPVAQQDVLGEADSDTDASGVEGTSTEKNLAQAIDADNTDGNALGLAWYWWLLIIAGGATGIWWLIAALRGRGTE